MFLTINEHTLHVGLAGNPGKPVMVLLHSLGTSSLLWQEQVRDLATDHHVICPDLRGHGLSEHSRQALTCELLAEDVLSLLDTLGVEKFALAGVSLGGVVAQIVAARSRGRISGLAIFDSYVASLNLAMWRERAAKVRADGLPSIAAGVLNLWMTDADAATPAGIGLKRMLETASGEGYAAACDALAIADNRSIAPQIDCPALVVAGAEDRAAPVAASEALAALIPGASVQVIANAAHIPLLHHAAECTAIIRAIV